MQFGVFYQLPCADDQSDSARYDDTIAQAQLADELGFDTVWLAELHFNRQFSVMPSPLLVGSAIAATTKRIKIGTAVNLVPLHHPIRLAEETATLDLLSHGRAIFGIGRGSNRAHFHGYGVDIEEGRSRFQEAIDLILKAWTEDELSFHGKSYQVEGIRVEPKPIQKPYPPVYVATNSPDTFGMVGAMGHNILIAPVISTTQGAQTGVEEFRKNFRNNFNGVTPRQTVTPRTPAGGNVSVNVPMYVAENREKARASFEVSINNYLDTLRRTSQGPGRERAMQLSYEQVRDEFAAVGEPEECVGKLQQLQQRYDAQELMCWFEAGGRVPHSEVKASMRLFAEKVMPHFR